VIWNTNRQVDLIKMSYLYIDVIAYFFAKEIVQNDRFPLSDSTKHLVTDIVNLYGANLIKDNIHEILMRNIIRANSTPIIDELLLKQTKILVDRASDIRSGMYHVEVGTIQDFRPPINEEREKGLLKGYNEGAKHLMTTFNHYSKL